MKYLCAISCCEPDLGIAETVHRMLADARFGAFFYRLTPLDRGLMLDVHAQIYCGAVLRLYLLRETSFKRYYPSFELNCGRNSTVNLIWPMEPLLRRRVPNDYGFVFEESWTWLDDTCDVATVVNVISKRLRAMPARLRSMASTP